MKPYSLSEDKGTFGLNLFDFFEQGLILSINLHVAHLLQGNLFEPLIQKLELLGPLLTEGTLKSADFGLVDLPGTFDVFVEAEFVADGD